ncbi:hypothetical protein NDU88_001972 [Pleurodeles waltl]|uniref:Uncharacterized protein n=1 Tax=Pleurodeles waltl TaxID=8319 RepID=A0AAV7VD79_PLEWA|nr:hypothetical protein NDU88_001972 [Pleurodeles waltl]
MPAPQHCWGARGCDKAHRAIYLKRPAFALDHIHASAPAWPPFGLRDRWELHFPAATVNASLPLVALGPESSGSGPTLALARIHAGAPALLGRPRVRQSTSRHLPKEARLCTRSHSCQRPGLAGAPTITAIISRLVTQRGPRR